jgi:hypothetical protein
VVKRFFPRPRRSDEDFQLLADLDLSDIFSETLGAQRALDGVFLAVSAAWRNETALGEGLKLVGFDHVIVIVFLE